MRIHYTGTFGLVFIPTVKLMADSLSILFDDLNEGIIVCARILLEN